MSPSPDRGPGNPTQTRLSRNGVWTGCEGRNPRRLRTGRTDSRVCLYRPTDTTYCVKSWRPSPNCLWRRLAVGQTSIKNLHKTCEGLPAPLVVNYGRTQSKGEKAKWRRPESKDERPYWKVLWRTCVQKRNPRLKLPSGLTLLIRESYTRLRSRLPLLRV